MDDRDIPVIELNKKTDLLATEIECPSGHKYLYGVPYIQVPCNKCGITFKTDFKQDIYTKKARQIISKLAFNNEVIVRATGDDYEGALIHIRHHFIEMACWNVSEISTSTSNHKRCNACGVCFSCMTCNECSTPFTKQANRRKQTCPSCKKSNFKNTRFDKVELKDNKTRVCPHCHSNNIRMTKTSNKTKCHICDSKDLTEAKITTNYEITIARKRAYQRENV